jgi:SHS2 domain-containing protein
MKRFKLIEHTADMGLVAYGHDLAEAFANAAYGLFSVMADLGNVQEKESLQVDLREDDTEALLFEWLNYLLYVFDVETLLLKRFDIQHFDGYALKATCHGEKYDPYRHRLYRGIKSATYHMLKIDREKNQVQVILDV